MKIKALGLAGLLFLTGCKGFSQEPTFENKYGTRLFMSPNGNYMYMGYDTDYDGKEDLRLIYEMLGMTEKGYAQLELVGVAEDKNRDGIFSKDEIRKITQIKPEEIL